MRGFAQDQPTEEVGYQNVVEDFDYFDTVLVYPDLAELSNQPPGWFAGFPALANVNQMSFFDVRNRANTDLAFCNVETRDMTPFAMEIDHIGVQFWSPANKILSYAGTSEDFLDGFQASFWENDLPRHCGVKLRVQQDEKLKTTAFMVPSGHGPVVGGFGTLGLQGQGVHAVSVGIAGQSSGASRLSNQWPFPSPIQIPRRAALSVVVEFNEYARQVLGAYSALGGRYHFAVDDYVYMPYGVTVSISGKRFVQQRGALHV